MTLTAGSREDHLACLLELSEGRIRIGQRHYAGANGIGQGAHTARGEQHVLKRAEVVQHTLPRRDLNLGVNGQCGEGLLLQRDKAPIQLIPAGGVGTTRPGVEAVRSGEFYVIDRGHHAPDVYRRLTGREGRCRARHRRPAVEELHVRGQRKRDTDKGVLA